MIDETVIGDVLGKIFSFQDGVLKIIDTRVKHNGKLDQAIRLTLLIAYAHEIINKSLERSYVKEVLKQFKLENPHSSIWLSNCDELLREGGSLKLSGEGREKAEQIINEIADPTVAEGKVNFSKTKSRSKRKNSKNDTEDNNVKDSKNKRGGNAGRMTPMAILEELLQEGFFAEKRKIKDIIDHCAVDKAQHYKSNEFSSGLKKLIIDKKLKRQKNTNDNQFEYYANT